MRVRHVALIDDAVRVAVDVREVADRDVVAERDAAAIVEQHVAVDDDVVADFHVVAEREFHVLERLEVLAAPLEDVRREQPAQLARRARRSVRRAGCGRTSTRARAAASRVWNRASSHSA